jgi:hypothetical protein
VFGFVGACGVVLSINKSSLRIREPAGVKKERSKDLKDGAG